MYFFKEKRFLVLCLFLVFSFSLWAQERKPAADTILVQQDSVITDTLLTSFRRISPNAIDKKVTYSAKGYIKREIVNKRVILTESAVVNYGEIEIKADSIIFNMNNNLLIAVGRNDTSGVIKGSPVFKEGSQEFECEELTYNFKTKKALVKNIVTKQDEGLLHSSFTKLLEDGTSNISKSTYSTCDADTPHFYINLPKARVYPGEKIISGPGNLVLEGIPLPLVIPFGYFPVNTKKAASGILFPRIGEERNRGYSLTDMGYYFAINNYIDLTLMGDVYTNGTWLANVKSSYNKLYKYNGNLSFDYANNVTGHKGLDDYNESSNYKLGWSFNQDPKASPGSRFSASVNMSSSGFDKNNSYVVSDHVTTTKQSSISYSKSWDGTPFNLSASMNQSQNVKTKTVSLNLPKANFNMGRIYPLKGKNSKGSSKWYQELQFQYSSAFDNQINTSDSLLFTSEVWQNMNNGFKHEAPLSIQLRPFNNFSISPSLTYSGVFYSRMIEKTWDTLVSAVHKDTIPGMYYGQAINPAIGASFNPQIYGMYSFINPDSRIQAIRHVIKPSVGFNYIPEVPGLSTNMYRTVQTDSTGTRYDEYSIFEGNIYGTPSLSKKSGSVSFSLTNIIEAKVFEKNDTTGKAKKVKIIDNFGINTSYNIFADSMRWAPVIMQIRTTLFENINISAGSGFSLYALDSKGKPVNTFQFSQNNKLMRMTNFGTSVDFSLDRLLQGRKDKGSKGKPQSSENSGYDDRDEMRGGSAGGHEDEGSSVFDEYGYQEFEMPWTLYMRYNINYSKPGLTSSITQTLSFNGDVTITKKMSMNYTSGYDFKAKEITMTTIGIRRDLHCWIMNLNWTPNGTMKGWNFTIRAKASLLSDLKYERRKDYHDNY